MKITWDAGEIDKHFIEWALRITADTYHELSRISNEPHVTIILVYNLAFTMTKIDNGITCSDKSFVVTLQ